MSAALSILFLIAGLVGTALLARISYREPAGARKARSGFQAVCCLAGGVLAAGLLYTIAYGTAPRKVITGRITSLRCVPYRNRGDSEFMIIGSDSESVPLTVPGCARPDDSRRWQEGNTATAFYLQDFPRPLSLQIMDGPDAGYLRTYPVHIGGLLFISLFFPVVFVAVAALQWKRMPDGVSRGDYQRGQEVTALHLNR